MNENLDIRVERGEPNSEELAAAIAVIQSLLAAAEAEAADASARKPNARSSWNRNHGLLRSPIQAGQGQWGAAIRAGLN
jgi:hypothetical protein